MIFGLDISTNVVGFTILDNSGDIVEIGHTDLSKLERELWTRFRVAKKELLAICKRHEITHIFVEEPVLVFTPGKSRASTLALLIRFNILCSYILMEETGIEPQYITASHARKVCGVQIRRAKNKKNPPDKEQAFEQLKDTTPFRNHEWPLKRTGRPKEHCFDEMDSYCVGRAGFLELVTLIPKKFG